MTKLQKTNEFTGKLEDTYPNLIIVSGKNIAVPVDKQHLVKNTDAKAGDLIWIKYDNRGYLLDAKLISRGAFAEKPMEKHDELPKELKTTEHTTQLVNTFAQVSPPPVKEYVSLRDRLIVRQTTYKECCDTVRCLMLVPEGTFDEEEFNRIMDIALARSLKDAKALIEAGEQK